MPSSQDEHFALAFIDFPDFNSTVNAICSLLLVKNERKKIPPLWEDIRNELYTFGG